MVLHCQAGQSLKEILLWNILLGPTRRHRQVIQEQQSFIGCSKKVGKQKALQQEGETVFFREQNSPKLYVGGGGDSPADNPKKHSESLAGTMATLGR